MEINYESKSSTVLQPPSKAAKWTGRVISALIILFMLQDAVLKIIKLPVILKYCEKYGLDGPMLQGIGITLLTCTIFYAIPMTTVLGAILLTGYLGGAILLHVRFHDPIFDIFFVFLFGVLVWLGVFLREPRLRAILPCRCGGEK